MQDRVTTHDELLRDIVAKMGYEVEVELREDDDHIMLNLDGEDAPNLIGKKGETLDAIQYLINKISSVDGEEHKPVVVDSNGYRQRRNEALEDMARQLGEKATQSGKTVAINPMSAHDRRIIHMALKETAGLTTRSEGEGIYRRLLIVPE